MFFLVGGSDGFKPKHLNELLKNKVLLGCPRKLGSMVRINGLFHLLINGIYWDEITH